MVSARLRGLGTGALKDLNWQAVLKNGFGQK